MIWKRRDIFKQQAAAQAGMPSLIYRKIYVAPIDSFQQFKRRRDNMSEFKPKKDDYRAGDGNRSGKGKEGDSPKPHGDKLQHAVDEAAEPAKKKR